MADYEMEDFIYVRRGYFWLNPVNNLDGEYPWILIRRGFVAVVLYGYLSFGICNGDVLLVVFSPGHCIFYENSLIV